MEICEEIREVIDDWSEEVFWVEERLVNLELVYDGLACTNRCMRSIQFFIIPLESSLSTGAQAECFPSTGCLREHAYDMTFQALLIEWE